MENFNVVAENKNGFVFVLGHSQIKGLETRVQITNGNGIWEWDFSSGVKNWNPVRIIDNKFIVELHEDLEETILDEINKNLYEILCQLKKHPAYRLKIIHMLNDETREIWKFI